MSDDAPSDYDDVDGPPTKRRRRKKDGDDWGSPSDERKTKRPENRCGECGYTWFPRGKSVSLRCPRCGGQQVKEAGGGCAGAVLLAFAAGSVLAIAGIAASILLGVT